MGTRPRPRAASQAKNRIGSGNSRIASRPAASPARAGTAATNGSAWLSWPALLAPRTPRSRSSTAPATARTTTSPSNNNRRTDGRAGALASAPDPNAGPFVAGIAATIRRMTVTAATPRRRREAERRSTSMGWWRWRWPRQGGGRDGEEQALDADRGDRLGERGATSAGQGEGRPPALGSEADDEREGAQGDHARADTPDHQDRRRRCPAGLEELQQCANGPTERRPPEVVLEQGRQGRRIRGLETLEVDQQRTDRVRRGSATDRGTPGTCSAGATGTTSPAASR